MSWVEDEMAFVDLGDHIYQEQQSTKTEKFNFFLTQRSKRRRKGAKKTIQR
jgi:hypothetical protein